MPANFPDSPTLNQTYTYGAMTWQWTGSYWSVVESANYTAVTAITANLVPSVNEVYNLGSATLRWRDLYLSGNSLVLGAATISASGSAITLPANSSIGTTSFGSTSLTTEDLTVTGNLTVNGTTTTINSTTLSIDDKNIVLADGAANAAAADGAGITVAGASATLTYASASDSWNVNKNILITPGTANGVLYLNASKVATTGSALTFDGAQLGVNGITIGRGAGAVATNTALGVSALTTNSTGSDNTAVGHQSLYSNSTGIQLTAFGSGALYNTTANSSVGVGYQAGYANTTGRITAIGYLALTANTTGDWNSAFGRQALYVNTTGSYNTSVGVSALYSNTTASYNTALGYQAGYANTTGNSNTYLGWNTSAAGAGNTGSGNLAAGFNALNNNTSGTSNTALGGGIYAVMASALESNTTGNYNVAVGTAALKSNTTASNNTAVGYQAMYSNTTGINTAFGTQALYTNTTGSYNAVFGRQAMYYNTGSENTAFGDAAMSTNSSGQYNTAVGRTALYNNTTGSNNTAVGWSALNANATGVQNTALGNSALLNNTTASNNTAVGYQAGYSNTTGGYNAILGYQSGYNVNTNYNTFIGYQAGYGSGGTMTGARNTGVGVFAGYSLTSGNYNAFFGSLSSGGGSAGSSITTGSSNTILGNYTGNQGGLDIRTLSNYIVLSDGDGNPRMYANGAAWTNPGSMNVGGMTAYTSYSQSFSLGTTQWIRLCQLGSPGTMRIKYFLGSNNSEEYGEVLINATYVTSNNQITVNRQSYNSHLLEVRLVASGSGYPYDVFFNIRSDQFAPSITWTPFDVRANGFSIYNDTTTPGAASSSLVLETGSGTVSNIVATNGLYGAYGGGVQFPATQVASSNANTLDDYEEGTFTPTLIVDSGTPTYQYQEGRYTKIGRYVYGGGIIGITNSNALTGGIRIQLPFTVLTTSYGMAAGLGTDGSGFTWPITGGGGYSIYSAVWQAQPGTVTLQWYAVSSAATSALYTSSGVSSTWYMRFNFGYFTN